MPPVNPRREHQPVQLHDPPKRVLAHWPSRRILRPRGEQSKWGALHDPHDVTASPGADISEVSYQLPERFYHGIEFFSHMSAFNHAVDSSVSVQSRGAGSPASSRFS